MSQAKKRLQDFKQRMERYAKTIGATLNPEFDWDAFERAAVDGKWMCPCRPLEHCPCKDHKTDIINEGHCYCEMFISTREH